jgi:hypothetical protein
VLIKVYDVLGNEIEFNSRGLIFQILPSDIYFYRIQAGSFVETKKMVLLK